MDTLFFASVVPGLPVRRRSGLEKEQVKVLED
jgi:hypothetical protein